MIPFLYCIFDWEKIYILKPPQLARSIYEYYCICVSSTALKTIDEWEKMKKEIES